MKIILAIAFLGRAAEVAAFSTAQNIIPAKRFFDQLPLHDALRPDANEAIVEATKISEEHGDASNNDAGASDLVEERSPNDISPEFVGSNVISVDSLSEDYYGKICSLHYLMEDTDWSMQQMKRLLKEIKALDLKDPSLARLSDGEGGDALKAALSDAKAAVEVHGATSTKATKAWNRLDSCFGSSADGVLEFSDECNIDSEPSSYRYSAAALKAHHLYNAAIDIELLDEALEALGMLKGLTKFVNIEKRRLDAGVSVDFASSD